MGLSLALYHKFIEAEFQKASSLPTNTIGAYAHAYEFIFALISKDELGRSIFRIDSKGQLLDRDNHIVNLSKWTLSQEEGYGNWSAKANVDKGAWEFLKGVPAVNNNVGDYSQFIRDYTKAQYELRFGHPPTNNEIQETSNKIAENILRDILLKDAVPSIRDIATNDAQAAAEILFGNKQIAGWAGNAFLPAVGHIDSFQENIIGRDGDTYNALSLVKSMQMAGFSDEFTGTALAKLFFHTLGVAYTSHGLTELLTEATSVILLLEEAYGFTGRSYVGVGLAGIQLGRGGTESDMISARNISEYIHAGGGNDTIYGSLQQGIDAYDKDIVDGGKGFDTLSFMPRSVDTEIRSTTQGKDQFSLEIDNATRGSLFSTTYAYNIERLIGSSGKDDVDITLDHNASLQILETGLGNDTIEIELKDGHSFTSLNTGAGNDEVRINGVASGALTLLAGDGNDRIFAGAGNSTIFGEGGNDVLVGQGGRDFIDGGDGNDIIVSDQGDTVYGGKGSDIFGITGYETIMDADASDYITHMYAGLDITGGIAYAAFDAPVAVNFWEGFYFAVTGGDINAETGADLHIRYLWRTGETIIKDYTRPWLGVGDGHIEIYQESFSNENTPLENVLKAYSLIFNNDNDPLVLDLNGNGFEMQSAFAGDIYFDVDKDGMAERTGWVKPGDGFLVRDLNANGKIDDAGEMFGRPGVNGFTALKALDGNGDNLISAADSSFASLKVWQDKDGDGVTDAGELLTLSQLGIKSINLAASAATGSINGNQLLQQSTVTFVDGKVRKIGEFNLDLDSIHAKPVNPPTVSAEVKAMPWLWGSGDVMDLDYAMTLDGTLKSLVAKLGAMPAGAYTGYDTAMQNILFRWAHVDGVAPGSRGDAYDARKLAFIEKWMGEAFTNASGSHTPTPEDVKTLDDLWNSILTSSKAALLVQSVYKPFFDSLSLDRGDHSFDTNKGYTLQTAFTKILNGMPSVTADAKAYWANFTPLLKDLAYSVERTNGQIGLAVQQLVSDLSFAALGKTLPLGMQYLVNTLLAGTEVKAFVAAGGNSDVIGTQGQDILIGNGGDNHFYGGPREDTYIIGKDWGHDVIYEDSGVSTSLIGSIGANIGYQTIDTVRFTHLMSGDAAFSREGDDLIITNKLTGDTLRIVGQFGTGDYASIYEHGTNDTSIEQIIFADGVSKTTIDIRGAVIMAMETDGDDYIRGTSDKDYIIGYKGNDTLVGGDNGDLYEFRRGDGHDIIQDVQQDCFRDATDALLFSTGITLSDLTLTRVEGTNDLLITFAGAPSDSILIKDQFWASTLGLKEFDPYGFLGELIRGNPWLQLGSQLELPEDFSNTGYNNHPGIRVTTDAKGNLVLIYDDPNMKPIDLPEASVKGPVVLYAPDNRIEIFTFSDGTVLTAEQLQQRIVDLAKTAGDDYIVGFEEQETLDGGAGNDTLDGGNDGDTYIFGKGYGQDVIDEHMTNVMLKSPDIIQLAAGITTDMITLYHSTENNDLVIGIKGTTDTLTVRGQFDSSVFGPSSYFSLNSQIEEIHFADGTVWTWLDIQQKLLTPTDGNDTLVGFFAHDIINGGKGDDVLMGGDSGDTYIFGRGSGHDVIEDNMWSTLDKSVDRVLFGPGITKSDLIFTRPYGTRDLIIQLKGSDDSLTIRGEFDFLFDDPYDVFSLNSCIELFYFQDGSAWSWTDIQKILLQQHGSGNDTLEGFYSDDVMDGGKGNDWLEGQGGSDTYIFAKGYGKDTFYEVGGDADKILFRDIKSTEVTFTRNESWDLFITIKGTSDKITVKEFFSHYNAGNGWNIIESFQFSDGVTLTWEDVMQKVIHPSAKDDTIIGTPYDDTIDGGAGNDSLQGLEGNDTYIFGRGYGQDIMLDSGGEDVLKFRADIKPSDVVFTRMPDTSDLIITIKGTSDSLIIKDFCSRFNAGNGWYIIETFSFADGTTYDWEKVMKLMIHPTDGDDYLFGGPYNDTLDGGKGNDTLEGGDGSDTYIYKLGYGHDVIADNIGATMADNDDTVRFGTGIRPEDVIITRNGNNDILFTFTGHEGDSLLIQHFDLWYYGTIDHYIFADGTKWDINDIRMRTYNPTLQNDSIRGYEDFNDTIYGLDGNDTLEGDSGNDVLIGGRGNDMLSTWTGNDVFKIEMGDGSDTIYGSYDTDTIVFGAGISFSTLKAVHTDTGLILRLDGGGTISLPAIDVERFKFFDGKVHSLTEIMKLADATAGTAGNNYIRGFDELNDSLFGAAGNDTIEGWNGNDRIDGGDGNDVLEGGWGNDTLIGGKGRDEFWATTDVDTVIIHKGDGQDIIRGTERAMIRFGDGISASSLRVTNDDAGLRLHLDGGGIVTVDYFDRLFFRDGVRDILDVMRLANKSGTAGDNLIYGFDNYNDRIDGGAGNDTLVAWSGDDYLVGGAGADRVEGRDGNDTLIGGTGDDVLIGDEGDDVFRIAKGNGTDELYGGSGNDTLEFGEGLKVAGLKAAHSGWGLELKLSSGNVIYVPNTDVEIFRFADGVRTLEALLKLADIQAKTSVADNIQGFDGYNDTIDGGAGDDTISGWSGDDKLVGSSGQDRLEGNDGYDILRGGTGADWLVGGSNGDYFVYRALNESTRRQADTIEDFTKGEDIIDLRGLGFTGIASGAASGKTLGYAYNSSTNQTVINAAGDFRIILLDHVRLDASDFLFN